MLLIVLVFFEKQAEGFFCTQLGNAGEVLYPETIQDLGSLQFPFATQRAFDGVGLHCGSCTQIVFPPTILFYQSRRANR